jgi:hypothetical protein
LNWELIHEVADKSKGEQKQALKSAYERVEEEEDEHLYHTTGWGRELWIESLGMPAVIPPPEEEQDVKTAIGAARAKNARAQALDLTPAWGDFAARHYPTRRRRGSRHFSSSIPHVSLQFSPT